MEQSHQVNQQKGYEQEQSLLTRKERKEIKRKNKIATMQLKERKKKIKKYLVRGGIALVGILFFTLIIWLVAASVQPPGPDFSQEMPNEGDQHFPEGTPLTYQSNPPTSGPHWPIPLADGIYRQEKPDEAIVHSMEHGRVWVSYHPSIPE